MCRGDDAGAARREHEVLARGDRFLVRVDPPGFAHPLEHEPLTSKRRCRMPVGIEPDRIVGKSGQKGRLREIEIRCGHAEVGTRRSFHAVQI